MSQLLPAEIWHRIYLRLLRHRSLLADREGLAPLLPAIEALEAELAQALSNHDRDDPTLRALQAEAAAIDASHDEAHAVLRQCFRAAIVETRDTEAILSQGLSTLYPEGLSFTHDAWALEVLHSAVFANRLEDPAVSRALAQIAELTPDVRARVEDCIREGDRLGAALDAIENHIIALSGGTSSKAHIFELRVRARDLWVDFVRALDTHHPTDSAAHGPLRAKLLATWERAHQTWQIDESDGG